MNTSDMPPPPRRSPAGSATTDSAWREPRRSPPCSRTLSCLRWGALLPHKSSLGLYASHPAEHFSFARSLDANRLCGVWTELHGVWGEAQKGTYTAEGIAALCEGLKGSAVTSFT